MKQKTDYSEQKHAYYEAHKDEIKKRSKEWASENPEKRKAIRHKYHVNNAERESAKDRQWRLDHPGRKRAHYLAESSIPLNAECDYCGKPARDRHHPDYSQPLKVVHLCKKCHGKIHAEEKIG
jgi:hypothetical protein